MDRWKLLLVMCAFVAAPDALAIQVGLEADFQDGTTQGWVAGPNPVSENPNPPIVIQDGGPQGVGDDYLLISSRPVPPDPEQPSGTKLTAFAQGEWAGDYIAAGVTHIAVDLQNLGETEVEIRFHFESPSGIPRAGTLMAAVLPPESGWMHFEFPVDPDSLLGQLHPTLGPADTLANVTRLRLSHLPNPRGVPNAFVGAIGVDNIRIIPEPGAGLLVTIGVVLISLRARGSVRGDRGASRRVSR